MDEIACGVRDDALRHWLFEEGPSLILSKETEMPITSQFAFRRVQEVRNSSPSHKIRQETTYLKINVVLKINL